MKLRLQIRFLFVLLLAVLCPISSALADCQPSPSGLAGWWPGDVNAGDIASINHGAFINQATVATGGFVSNAFSFDGDYDFVEVPDSPSLRPQQFTVEAWIKMSTVAGQRAIVMKESDTGVSYALLLSSGGYLQWIVNISGTNWGMVRATAMVANQWYHVAATYDGFFMRMYVDGGNVMNAVQSGTVTQGAGPLVIGGSTLYNVDFAGRIDEVSLYNRALSGPEISALFAAGSQGKCKGPGPPLPIVVWGNTTYGETNIPVTLTNAIAIAAEGYQVEHLNLGLKSDRTVSGWGYYYNGVGNAPFIATNLPPGLTNLLTISTGFRHGLALRGDGTVIGIGDNSFGQTTIPPGLGTVVSAVAGGLYSLALKSDGTVAGWGSGSQGEATPPAGLSNVVAVAAGYFHSLATKNDGSVVGWGLDWYGQAGSPAGLSNVVAVSAGSHHSLALKSDGTVVAWGYNFNGQSDVPAGLSNVVAIAAGFAHSLALKRDGTVTAWGNNASGQASPPSNLSNVVAIAAGNNHSLALLRNPVAQTRPALWWPVPTNQTYYAGQSVVLLPTASGSLPTDFQWYFNGTPLAGQTNRWLSYSALQTNQTGNYKLIAGNSAGSATSAVVNLNVVLPWLGVTAQPTDQVVAHGGTFSFTADGTGLPSPSYQWQRNGTNLVNSGRVSGANSPTLTIANAQLNDGGSYRLVLSNGLVVTNSNAAVLSIVPLRVWGNNFFGQTNIPLTMTSVVAASAGSYYNLVLMSDGIITGWGFGDYFQTAMPWGLNNPKAITAGNNFSVAIADDRRVWAWGVGESGQTAVPPSAINAVAVSSGGYHGLALRWDGSLVGWGYNNSGQGTPPAGTNFVAVAAGGYHSIALRTDGKVVGFGNNYPYGQATPPVGLDNVVAIAAGADHCLALKNDGTVAAWGDNYYGQASVPGGLNNIIAIAAGHFHNLALKRDGTIVVWGDNSGGQSVAPAGLSNVVAVSGGNFHSLALLENPNTQIAPSFLWPPTDRTVGRDATTLFRPLLSGSLPMRYQWYSEGVPLPGQTNGWLLLNSLQTNHSGGYQLVAHNQHGAVTSAVAMLNVVLLPPEFTLQPQSAIRPVGSSVTFNATVTGTSPLSYQWFFNDLPLDGKTVTSLALSNLQTNQTGSYWLVASNEAGATTSQVAVLDIGHPPEILVTPDSQTVPLNGNVSFAVTATGSELISYQWRKNLNNLSDDERIQGATSNTLNITGLQSGDAGNYDVIVSNPYGSAGTPSASLNIIYPPDITTNPVSQVVSAGSNIVFTVIASGTPPFTYQWRFDSNNLPGRTNATLTLTNAQAGNIGDYTVVISNAAGMATSTVATLTVLPSAPIITTQPSNKFTNPGVSVIFTVTAIGTEPMDFHWRKESVELGAPNSATLTLANLQAADAGNYDVVVSNGWGSVTSSVTTLTLNLAVPDSFNPGANGAVNALALQPDGKILMGGTFINVSGQTRLALARLNPDGTPDLPFNPGGFTQNQSNAYFGVSALLVQTDGGIVVVGSRNGRQLDGTTSLWRIRSDGADDTNFVSNFTGSVTALAAQPDGKLWIAGSFTVFKPAVTTNLARLNPNGSFDSNFVATIVGTVNTLALQPDGKLVIGGAFTTVNGTNRNRLARFNFNGTLDGSFNPNANNTVNTVAVQPDGRILVGGQFTTLGGTNRNRLARLNADGTVDTNFNPNVNGTVSTLALQTDGRIVMGGSFTTVGGTNRNRLARLNVDGSLDTTFNPGANNTINALAIQADGAILVGGGTGAGGMSVLGGLARTNIGRLSPTDTVTQSLTFNGSTITWLRGGNSPEVWRTTFDVSTNGVDWIGLGAGERVTGGWQLTGLSFPAGANLRARGFLAGALANASSGFVETITGPALVVSQPASRTNNAGTVATFYANGGGTPPLSFQWFKGGTALTNAGNIFGSHTTTLTLTNVLGGDAGNYSLVISNLSGNVTSTVATLTVTDPIITSQPAGVFTNAGQSASFSVAAIGTGPAFQWLKNGTEIPGATNATLTLTNAQQPDIAGYRAVVSSAFGVTTSAVANLTLNLALPDSLNTDVNDQIRCIALDAHGRILIGGNFNQIAGQWVYHIARLFSDGSVDTSFTGKANSSVDTIAVQPDGRILVGGWFSGMNDWPHSRIGRFNPDGSLDPDFNPAISSATLTPFVDSLVPQPDGKVLVGGWFTSLAGQSRSYIARLNTNGTVDSFNPGADTHVIALALQPDGKIIAGGNFTVLGGTNRSRIGRLHPDGGIDTAFDPGANSTVNALVLQPDGRLLVGGSFTTLAGQSRGYLGRLNTNGTLDTTFSPSLNGGVSSVALQADGSVLIVGGFTTVGGQPRGGLARVSSTGVVDPYWGPQIVGGAGAIALQPDGKVLIGGDISSVLGQPRNRLARLADGSLANSQLHCNATTISWWRNGAAPEVSGVTFETSADGTNWTSLGLAARVAGGWQSVAPMLSLNSYLRAHGFASGGRWNGSLTLIEDRLQVSPLTPPVILSSAGSISHHTNKFTFNIRALPGQAIVIEASTNFIVWIPLQTNVVTSIGQMIFADARAGDYPNRYYRARVHDGLLPPPTIQSGGGNFGFAPNGFGFDVSGIVDQTLVVDGSTNLVDWTPISTNTLTTSPLFFSDPGSTNFAWRFYRVRAQ